MTVNPLAPTVTWAVAPSAGLEGSTIALGSLAVTVNGLAGEANSLTSLVVSAIPVGATLSDGANTFTATAGHTSVNVGGWALSSLTITPSTDVNFTLSAAATVKDAEGNLSTAVTTEAVTVTPLAPTLAPVAVTGVENAALALNLGATVNKLTGDTNSMASLVVSALPVGTKLTDGTATHTFTATAGNTSVDINGWTLSNLKITPATDTNFTLSIAATAKDANGDLSAITTATDLVTVNPLAATMTWAGAPSAGVEGSPLALGTIAVTLHSSAGDTNNLASLVVSAIPIGATLSDGTNTFTASAGNTSVDINGWTLTSLKITPATDTNFTLSVAATEKDAEGNLSTTTTATEVVTVNPLAPTVTWAATPAVTIVAGTPFSLGTLSYALNGNVADNDHLKSMIVSGVPVGATLSDGTHTFTATAGHTSIDVSAWTLGSLSLKLANLADFTLSASAVVQDIEGNLSTTSAASVSTTIVTNGTVNTSNGVIDVAQAGTNLTVNGNNDTLNVTAGSATIVLHGTGDTVVLSASGGTLNLTASQTSLVISGGNDVVTVTGSGDTISFTANNAKLNLSDPNNIVNFAGSNDTAVLLASNDTVNVNGSSDNITVSGSNNNVNITGAADVVTLTGSGVVVSMNTASEVALVGSPSAGRSMASTPKQRTQVPRTRSMSKWIPILQLRSLAPGIAA